MRTRLFGISVMVMLLVLSGCTRSDGASALPEVPFDIKKQLAFACTHEVSRIPPRDPEADQLYKREGCEDDPPFAVLGRNVSLLVPLPGCTGRSAQTVQCCQPQNSG